MRLVFAVSLHKISHLTRFINLF